MHFWTLIFPFKESLLKFGLWKWRKAARWPTLEPSDCNTNASSDPGLIVSTLVLGFQICLRLLWQTRVADFSVKQFESEFGFWYCRRFSKCGRASLLSLAWLSWLRLPNLAESGLPYACSSTIYSTVKVWGIDLKYTTLWNPLPYYSSRRSRPLFCIIDYLYSPLILSENCCSMWIHVDGVSPC